MKKVLLIASLLFNLRVKAQLTGRATYYADKFVGRKTATGEIYSHERLTAASNHFKLGTIVRVTNLLNLRTVIVRINDRMAYRKTVIIDLSRVAARVLKANQLTKVNIQILNKT